MTTLNKLTLTQSKRIEECGMIHLVGVLFHLYGSKLYDDNACGRDENGGYLTDTTSRCNSKVRLSKFYVPRMYKLNHF